jgi:hypothetical protein
MIGTQLELNFDTPWTTEEEEAMKSKADEMQVSGTHYKDMSIQPWTVMEAVLTHEEFVGYLKGNIIKYSMRAGRKEGSDDAGKAHHYRMKLKEVQDGRYS